MTESESSAAGNERHAAPVDASDRTEARERIEAALTTARRVAVGTHMGEEVRVRMMHPGAWIPSEADARPLVYLASMKSDPKIREMTNRPEVALLMHESPDGQEGSSWEMEITGRAEIVRDPAERERAKAATMKTSSIVQYLDSVGQTDLLAFIRVTPRFMKHRVFQEIVAGRPPSIIEFAHAGAQERSDMELLRARAGAWKEAVRWPSLTASLASVLVGVSAAFTAAGTINVGVALLTLIAAVSLQACTNLKNDLDDQLSGADDRNRTPVLGFTGGSRVLQRGLATRGDVLLGMTIFGLVSASIGVYFALSGRPLVLLWGAAGLLVGWVYTGPPFRLANRGLGELAVALAFGVGIVTGSAYVQLGFVPPMAWAASVPVSILVALILFINGFQDAASDAEVEKRTSVVRLGLSRASRIYPLIAAVAMLALVALVLFGPLPPSALLALLAIPLFTRATRVVLRNFDRPLDLVPANAYTAVGHLTSAVLLAAGLSWAVEGELGATTLGLLLASAVIVAYYWRSINRLAAAFEGVKDAVARS